MWAHAGRRRIGALVTLGAVVSTTLASLLLTVTPAAATDGITAYVTDDEAGTVTPIATATNTVGTPINVGAGPIDVALSPDSRTVYVTNGSANTVSVISAATHTVTATIPVGTVPVGVAITPDGGTGYVVNEGSDTVSVISTVTKSVIGTVAVGGNPLDTAITPDGQRAYVVNWRSSTVSVINVATNTVSATIGVGRGPTAVAITPDGRTAYVTNGDDNTVTPIATATNRAGPRIPVESRPSEIAITPNGATAYVRSIGSGSVTPISTATNTAGTPIRLPWDSFVQPLVGLAVTPDGTSVYAIGSAGRVHVISTATNTVELTVQLGPDPRFIAITTKASPILSSRASGSVPAGGWIFDTATLSGGANPAGTVTFDVFGPGDTACASSLASFTATVSGATGGTYGATSGTFTTTTVGTYRWVARYGGDVNNNSAGLGACDDPNQQVVVVVPRVTVTATADISSTNATPGADGYTITVSNPTASPAMLTSITDVLPDRFAYTAGSTEGPTTADPNITEATLTWKGPWKLRAGETLSLHFKVIVAPFAGMYYTSVSAEGFKTVVVPTADTAPVRVIGCRMPYECYPPLGPS